jgi:hypothetical protein
MLVTFRTKAWGNITMFGDVAVALLKMMGHSGTVPSAMLARDVPAAMARLREQLAAGAFEELDKPSDRDDDEDQPPVKLRTRAQPLLEMLAAAAKQECDVLWQAGEPPL